LPLASAGNLTLNGLQVFSGQLISITDWAAGGLRFVPLASIGSVASFTFQVQDDGGTFNGGVDIDPTPNTLTFNVVFCGEFPIGYSSTVTTLEDTPYTFSSADFPQNDGNDQILDFRLILPPVGSLQVNGVAATVGQSVSVADLASGKLRYVPPAN